MNKLTAEYASELAEAVKLFVSQPLNFPLSRGQIMEVARIALPILEQQERGGWIEWGGKGSPVKDPMVEVKFRNGEVDKDIASHWVWFHEGAEDDIIAYRIIPERSRNQKGE